MLARPQAAGLDVIGDLPNQYLRHRSPSPDVERGSRIPHPSATKINVLICPMSSSAASFVSCSAYWSPYECGWYALSGLVFSKVGKMVRCFLNGKGISATTKGSVIWRRGKTPVQRHAAASLSWLVEQGWILANSSFPPSSDRPGQRSRIVKPTMANNPPVTAAKRRSANRASQPGHSRHERTLIPTEECDRVESFRPACHVHAGAASTTCPKTPNNIRPERHQFFDFPDA